MAAVRICKFAGGGEYNYTFTYSIFYAILWLSAIIATNKFWSLSKRDKKYFYISAVLFSGAFIAGALLTYRGHIFSDFIEFAEFIFFSCMAAFTVSGIISFFVKHIKKYCAGFKETKKIMSDKKFFLICFGLMLLCWTPVFLAFYPSIFSYDAGTQLKYYVFGGISDHHPIIHTYMAGFFYKLGTDIFSSPNFGVAMYTICQMIIMSFAFTYTILYMYKNNCPAAILAGTFIFYAIVPINSMMVLSLTKDVIFSGLFLLIIVLWYYRLDRKRVKVKIFRDSFLWTVMILFRNNALYAVLITAAVLILLKQEALERKRKLIFFSCVLAVYGFSNYALMKSTQAARGSILEAYCLPIEQIARTMHNKSDDIPGEQKEKILKFIPQEAIDKYNPYIVDSVKSNSDEKAVSSDKIGFFGEWIKLCLKYPEIYIDAYFDINKGYYFLDDFSHSEIYGVGNGFGYLMTHYKEFDGVEKQSYLPGLEEKLVNLFSYNEYQNIPVFSSFFGPAFYVWILITFFIVMLYLKKYKLIIPCVFIMAYFFTVTLGPACLVRYVYPVIVSVPLLISIVVREIV